MIRLGIERAWLAVVLAFVVLVGIGAALLPRLGVDANTELLLDKKDPDLTYYARSIRLWSSDDEFAIVCCRRADWFTPASLAILKELETALDALPNTTKVMSLYAVPLLRQSPFPIPMKLDAKGIDLAKARDELTTHTLAKGTFISADGKDACLLVFLEKPAEYDRLDKERNAALEAGDDAKVAALDDAYQTARGEMRARRIQLVGDVRRVARDFELEKMDAPIRLSGLPVINVNLIEHVSHDVDWFGAACLVVFTLGFAVIYRRVRWTLLPIVTCVVPVVLVLGAMAFFGERLTVITANLPLLLFVIMLPYTVYFVERYRERRAANPAETNVESTVGAAQDIWLPCFYSCITTMAAFASLWFTSGVRPIWSFGMAMTIGLGVGLVCTFLFLPAASIRMKPLNDAKLEGGSEPAGVVRLAEKFVLRKPLLVVLAAAAMLVAAAAGMRKLTPENKFIDYFWPESEVYAGLDYIDRQMGGTTPADIVLTSKEPGFFRTEKGLAAITAASAYVRTIPEAGTVTSLATLVEEARKAIPKMTTEGVTRIKAVEPLVRDVASEDFSKTRITVRFRETAPTLNRRRILDGLRADLATRPELAELEPRVTGVFLLYSNMLESLRASLAQTSLSVTVAIVTMLFILLGGAAVVVQRLPRDIREALQVYSGRERPTLRGVLETAVLAVIILVPQALPSMVVLGVMGWCGIPLDLITVTIAAIAMGVSDDSAIQYTVRYRMELAATGGDRRRAVTLTHATIGRAIWIATTIMLVGFAVLGLSEFVPTVMFGVLTALAMLMGQFATLTLLPSLFLLTGLPRAPADSGRSP